MPRASVAAAGARPGGVAGAPGAQPAAVRRAAVRRVAALLELARWPNALIAAGGVALGAWWSARTMTGATALAAIAAVGLAALANAFNDRRDRAIDAVAHPRRPIPSGRATVADADMVAAAGFVVALVASALVSPALVAATVVVASAMVAYSIALKSRGLAGNVAVALLASLPFVYGAWSVGASARAAALLYGLAVPLHFARELAKDLDDADADAAAGRRTLPVSLGAARARGLLAGVLVVFVGLAAAAFLRGGPLAATLVVPALVCCAAAGARARAGRHGAPRLLKAAMLLAMAAAFAARAGRLL